MHYLERIWAREQREKLRKEQEEIASRGWAEDLRWRYVYGYIAKARDHDTEVLDAGPDGVMWDHYVLRIDVRFDGMMFHSRINVHPEDVEDIPLFLNEMVFRIDDMMLEHGIPPYKIATHA